MSAKFDINDLDKRMRAAVDVLKREFAGLRTGRASASLLEPVQVQLYGQRMPLSQVGTISVPESRMLSVQVWDKAAVSAVDKAIREANLGLNPIIDGQLIRMPIPMLTADRRAELVKIAHKYTEAARVAVRNVRRDGMEALKKAEKDGDMSQDDHKKNSTKVQELTDKIIKEIDAAMTQKDAEINKV